MEEYIFHINGEDKKVEAEDLEGALREAGIEEGDTYELIEGDDFRDKCLLSAITDDILFGP